MTSCRSHCWFGCECFRKFDVCGAKRSSGLILRPGLQSPPGCRFTDGRTFQQGPPRFIDARYRYGRQAAIARSRASTAGVITSTQEIFIEGTPHLCPTEISGAASRVWPLWPRHSTFRRYMATNNVDFCSPDATFYVGSLNHLHSRRHHIAPRNLPRR